MKGSAPVLAALACLFSSSPAFALRAAHLHELGAAQGAPYELRRTAVTALADGGYVAAWERRDGDEPLGTGARIFDASGEVVGDVSCLAPPDGPEGYRAALAPTGDGFVLACESVHLESPPWFTTHGQRFSAAGETAGDAFVFDDALISQLTGMTARDGDSWIVSRERCDGQSCPIVHTIQSTAGRTIGEFVVPRIDNPQLVTTNGARLLAIGAGRAGTRGRVGILARLLDADGESLGPVTRLARAKLESFLQVITGEGGRTAVSWSTIHRSRLRTTFVRTIDANGLPSPGNVAIPFPVEEFGTTTPAFALPLAEGFLLAWTQSIEHWDDPVLTYSYATFVQEFREDGTPVGEAVKLPGGVAAISSVAYRERDRSYFAIGLADHRPDGADLLELYRIGLEHRCGDTDGDETVDALDAQRILRASTGEEDCDACRCDVDGSGTIDEADAEAAIALALTRESGSCPVCAED